MNVIEAARAAGMNVSLWDYGAGSIVFTMGTEGLARGALERFAQIIRNQALEDAASFVEPAKSLEDAAPTVVGAFEALGKAQHTGALLMDRGNCETAMVALKAALFSTEAQRAGTGPTGAQS